MFPKELYDFLMLMGTTLISFVVCQKIRTSVAIGYLLSGILLGPLGIGLFSKTTFINTLSQVGILLFLFTVGLEIPFHRIRALKRYIFGLGLAQVCVTSLGFTAILSFFLPFSVSVLLAISLTFSSTAVVVQLLSERYELTTHLGRTALSILLFQDIVAIFVFVYLGFYNAESASSWITIVKSGGGFFISIALGFGLALVTERILSMYRYSEFITAFVILTVLIFSIITEWFHLSSELGAFIAGMAMASTHWRHQISSELHPFRTLFLAIFFIAMGLEIYQWPDLVSFLWILGGLLGVMVLKTLTIVLCMKTLKFQGSSWQLGILMGGCSEFLFMILPLMAPHLGRTMTNNFLVMGFLSMILTPFLFLILRKIIAARAPREIFSDSHSVMIAGFGHVGQTISRILEHNFISFLVVDHDISAVEKARESHYQTVHGDVRDIDFLKKIKVFESKVLLITFGHLFTSVELVKALKRKFPHLSICIQVKDYHDASRFAGLGVHVIVPEAIESGIHMASLTLQFLGFSSDFIQKMVHFPQKPSFLGSKK